MYDVIIIGAGPAGLTATYELSKNNKKVLLLEKKENVGGLAETKTFGKYRYDIGPHRFFTKNNEINDLFLKVLDKDAVKVNRKTRILFNGKYFDYPLTPINALFGLGIVESFQIGFSYIIARLKSKMKIIKINNFEDWVIDRFGKKLYSNFFKNYTEKVWGVNCKDISTDWAAQRIKNLSFISVILNPFIKYFKRKKIKTLVDQFWYPKLGAGQFYHKLVNKIDNEKFTLNLNSEFTKIEHDNEKILSITVKDENSNLKKIDYDHYFISSPFTKIVENLSPKPPENILTSCKNLKYRHHIGVKLLVSGKSFPDNWIYIHDPKVKMARVSNYLNFSKEMSKDPNINPLTVEYFCFEEDQVWKMNKDELISLAEQELRFTKLINESNINQFCKS